MLEITAIASRTIPLVRPNSLTKIKDIVNAKNGDVIQGDANDVTILQSQKSIDLQIINKTINDLETKLAKVFLLNSSLQRSGERVTATEIEYMAQELETSLGGVYSVLAQELQLPLIKRLLKVLSKDGIIPKLPKDSIDLTITTGIEALGRSADANKMIQYIQTLGSLVGQEQVFQMIDFEGVATQLGVGLGIDTSGIVKKKEQVQEEQEDVQAQEVAANIAPQLAGQGQ